MENKSLDLKRAEQSFLSSQRKAGGAKKKGRPTKDAIIQKALRDNSAAFFKRVLDDESEEKLWRMFITGKAEQLDPHGQVMKDPEGRPFYIDIELNAISWNAFKQMVAYKRGMPAIKVDADPSAGKITVNFNVMGSSQENMEKKVRELGLLPVSTP
jgi:hypothetical protein